MNDTAAALTTVYVANLRTGTVRPSKAEKTDAREAGRTTYRLEDGSILTTGSIGEALNSQFTAFVAETFDGAKAVLVACALARLRFANEIQREAERIHHTAVFQHQESVADAP